MHILLRRFELAIFPFHSLIYLHVYLYIYVYIVYVWRRRRSCRELQMILAAAFIDVIVDGSSSTAGKSYKQKKKAQQVDLLS